MAAGFAAGIDPLVRAGAVTTLVGALALAIYAAQTWRTKSSWSGDVGWHRFAMGGLVSAIAWFEMGIIVAAGRLIVAGADPSAATATVLLGPMVPGWMGLAVLASATHIVPAIGPGDPAGHARQRRLLGQLGGTRLVLADLGIAALAVGIPWAIGPLVVAGIALVVISLVSTASLLAVAAATGIRSAQAAGNLRA